MVLEDIATRIALFQSTKIRPHHGQRAAVSIVLAERGREAEFLVIKRAERLGDPWSGHMALPGGRQQVGDPDLVRTAERETQEEIGLDLPRFARPIGELDDLQATDHGRLLDLVITPYVYELTAPPPVLVVDPREVQEVLWVPLSHLGRADAKAVFRYEINGVHTEHPAFSYRDRTIWGLTHRIITQLLSVICDP